MTYIEVPDKNRDAKMHYLVRGNGKPLVLIHGWLCTSEFWQELHPLSEKGYQLIIPDLRGHGKSSYAEDLSIERLAADINLLLERLQIDKAIIIGQSMGGMVAQAFYHKFPAKVLALGLWNTGSRIPFGHGLQTSFYVIRIISFLFGLIITYPIDELFRSVLCTGWKLAFHGKGKSSAYRKYVPLVYANSPKVLLKFAFSMSKFNGSKLLKKIAVPTMVIHGSFDKHIVVVQMAEELNNNIPNSSISFIQQSAHFSLNEQPLEVYSRFTEFLEKNNLD